jgi:hypothetical protein
MSQQDNFKGDALQKLASAGFIISAVLLIVFNILAPRPADPTNIDSVLTTLANQKFLSQLGQLMLALAFWGVVIGSVGVYRSITDHGAAWARLGFYGIVAGSTLWNVTFGLASVTANAAADWVAASARTKPPRIVSRLPFRLRLRG